MKTSPIRYALFAASAILLLAGCVKMPKPGTQNPEEPDNPDWGGGGGGRGCMGGGGCVKLAKPGTPIPGVPDNPASPPPPPDGIPLSLRR